MAFGPGKYDSICTIARQRAKARAVLMMVFDGRHGSGFSVQAPIDIQVALPRILRDIASQIEASMEPDSDTSH